MEAELYCMADDAIAALRRAMDRGGNIGHQQMLETVAPVIDLRNRMLDAYRQGGLSRDLLDRANAIASLAYSTEFPISGVHAHRIDQACKALSNMIEVARREEHSG